MSRHRLTHADAYTSLAVLDLLVFFNTLTLHQDRAAARVQHEVSRSGNHFLNAEQQRVFHSRAEAYADLALAYAQEHPGGRDRSATGPAMLLVQETEHATQQLAEDLGIVKAHPDHGIWAICRAILPAFAWVKIKYGHVEAEKRYHRAVRAVRSLATGDAPRQQRATAL